METSVNSRKAFTSIEQSEELEKFLPQESSDMYYLYWKDDNHLANPDPFVADGTEERKDGLYTYLSSWSLTALLNLLPTLNDRNAILCKDIRFDKWHVCYHSTATLPIIDTERYDNPVDACVEMITKLNDFKLL